MTDENRETRTIDIQETQEVTLFSNPLTEAFYGIASRIAGILGGDAERVERFRRNRMIDALGRRFDEIMTMCVGRDTNIYFEDVRFMAYQKEVDQVQAKVANIVPIDEEDVALVGFNRWLLPKKHEIKVGAEYRLAEGKYFDQETSLRMVISPARKTGGLQTQDLITIAGLQFRRCNKIVFTTKDQMGDSQQHSLETLQMAKSLLDLTAKTLRREHIQETGIISARVALASD